MVINKKLIRKWIHVLRSRKYKQGRGCLREKGPTKRSVDRYCCLGVLCDIINPQGWQPLSYLETQYSYKGVGDTYNESVTLPDSCYQKIGVEKFGEQILMHMNDSGRKFHEIADYLERTYL